jgi:hypothetical protein
LHIEIYIFDQRWYIQADASQCCYDQVTRTMLKSESIMERTAPVNGPTLLYTDKGCAE